ncbi:hydrogenase subunit MbhD domain-containing protein [Nesterenkonia sp. HG001]|uniref:hydrogenase subunit MbhD domain-containing protein n=1 Tax=Nesterenkonia sp. HG001 TaxID=2983207 RepID=UPI002AC4322C|nr:hydrogenase subunit MbhD domain-containing protein [Nesterenkonia sp. HG001]MDZ5077421.1 DUF4040 domain-containing protein [Nesterenkonia sp. HG001]
MSAIDVALGLAVLMTTAAALLPRRRSAQAMSFLGLGVMMVLLWLHLGSVDVALAEAALGTGLLSALLVLLARGEKDPARQHAERPSSGRRRLGRWIGTGGAWLLVTAVMSQVWLGVEQRLPAWREPLPASMGTTGVDHEITGVLLTFRSYDTLLESAVLMLAGAAVLALSGAEIRAATWSPGETMTWWARLSAPVLLLLGLWLLFAGSSDSGGAFQAGAVLAGMLMLADAAGVGRLAVAGRLLALLLTVGVVVFLVAAALGPLGGRAWLDWSPAGAFAVVLTVEITLTLGIAAALHLLYLGLRPTQEVLR